MLPGSKKAKDGPRLLSASCPDERCGARLLLPAAGGTAQCSACGRSFEVEAARGPAGLSREVTLQNLLRNFLLTGGSGTGGLGGRKPIAPLARVDGLCNYQCKLLSPILTVHGMDRATGRARLLSDMGQGSTFDCAVLGDRGFRIEAENLAVEGYGRDRSGSMVYLRETLRLIAVANGDEERLVPIHAEMDGHCLVHAVSRALVGWELFWHALRQNLKAHFRDNLERYKELFREFVDMCEWQDIVSECDPAFVPPEGVPLGLRNIHIFGLANVLRRPILLLDSWEGMQSPGDYSATFLPGLVEERLCRGHDGRLNEPLCVAWSSADRNHYIPLVGVLGRPPPRLPGLVVPKAWGVPQALLRRYVDFDEDGSCTVGGSRPLRGRYVRRLVAAMEEVYAKRHGGLCPSLVADARHYVYRRPDEADVAGATALALRERRLYRCLSCEALLEFDVPAEWLAPGGRLYELARRSHGLLRTDRSYSFPHFGVVCSYVDGEGEGGGCLEADYGESELPRCAWCGASAVRKVVSGDGAVLYKNGDRTRTTSGGGTGSVGRCDCGFKHFWDGGEYDRLPEELPVTLEWGGSTVHEIVYWFQHESDASLNSNAYAEATKLVAKHFPGEFGSELLVQKVVNAILRQTAKRNADGQRRQPVSLSDGGGQRSCGAVGDVGVERTEDGQPEEGSMAVSCESPRVQADAEQAPPSKIILTGPKGRTLHREELTMSQAEQDVARRISDKAPSAQRKATDRIKQQQQQQQQQQNHQQQKGKEIKEPLPTEVTTTAALDEAPHGGASSGKTAVRPEPEKKIRAATADGRQATLTLLPSTTFAELRASVEREFGIPVTEQRIRFGFPPRELSAPAPGDEDRPLPLQHGERISVESLAPAGDSQGPRGGPVGQPERRDLTAGGGPARPPSPAGRARPAASADELDDQENIDLEMSSLHLLVTLTGQDMWSYVKKMPYLFQQGGVFYKKVRNDIGLVDGKHVTLPELPGRTLVYNGDADRLELCLEPGGHFPVGPELDRDVAAALETRARHDRTPTWSRSREGSPSHHGGQGGGSSGGGGMKLGSGGAIVRRSEQQHNVHAFHGKGHSLVSGPAHSPPERSGTMHQASGASSPRATGSGGGPSSSSSSPARAPRESEGRAVRVGPGFTTHHTDATSQADGSATTGSSISQAAIGEQRQRLLEMVSAIQASVEKHMMNRDEQIPPGSRRSPSPHSPAQASVTGAPLGNSSGGGGGTSVRQERTERKSGNLAQPEVLNKLSEPLGKAATQVGEDEDDHDDNDDEVTEVESDGKGCSDGRDGESSLAGVAVETPMEVMDPHPAVAVAEEEEEVVTRPRQTDRKMEADEEPEEMESQEAGSAAVPTHMEFT
ncbi:deubiquitinating protein VCPIP1 isoform X2 [Lethenteron reissneri]|uniref:deubiquitinating protein VCPIP1 isoform X2 n=1 Tax=Lethenteron reissneri TaxID=7753 RepID=UPI002AB7263C|nr:deubiquitinating protein VCPIP1 isoform X2 [Lethenteron reissneri]